MENKNNSNIGLWQIFLFALGIIVVYKIVDNFDVVFGWIGMLFESLETFFWGFLIAYLLSIPCDRIERRLKKTEKFAHYARGISITVTYVASCLLIYVLARTLLPAIYKSSLELYNNIPYYITKTADTINSLQEKLGIVLIDFDTEATGDNVLKILKQIDIVEFGKYAQGVINLTSGVIQIFIAFIISIYMLIDKERIFSGVKRVVAVFMPKNVGIDFSEYIQNINKIFSNYIFSRLIDALIITVISTLLLIMVRAKYALFLGCMIGVLNLIPYFGSILSTIIAALICVFTGGWLHGVWVAIILTILQQIDGNVIGPKIMGDMLNARPLLIILAVVVGGGLFGVVGMLFSVPVVMVLRMIAVDWLVKMESKAEKEKSE